MNPANLNPANLSKERFERLEVIFTAVLEAPATDQSDLARRMCGDDAELREEVLAMLAEQPGAGFLEPATEPLAEEGGQFSWESAAVSGKVLGAWRLERMVGRGGMGSVFLAVRNDGRFDRQVAIKLLDATHELSLNSGDFERRFRREGEILGRLDHPNIARLLDAGVSAEGQSWFVMEYVEGQTCTEWSNARGVRETLAVFLRICDAVQYAHTQLVVHRDLKPSNILVDSEGQPHLVDFGIARLLVEDSNQQTRTGFRAFSLNYASPQQILGKPPSTSDDVYSLGAVLFEMLAGRTAYTLAGMELPEILRFAAHPEVVSNIQAAPLNADLAAVLQKAMAPVPQVRYDSVAELAADLKRHLEGFPVRARRPGNMRAAWMFVQRKRVPVAATAALVLAFGAAGIVTFVQWRRAERRFDESRNLARYVLFEMYDSLFGLPGTLVPLNQLAVKTQQYLDGLARDRSSDSSLALDLAASYQRLGDLQGRPYAANLGDSRGALVSYGMAVSLLEDIAAKRPKDVAIRERMIEALTGQGRILTRQRRLEQALTTLTRAVGMAEALSTGPPRHAELLCETLTRLAEARYMSGEARRSVAEFREILAMYRRALEIAEKGASPTLRELRISALFRIGYTLASLADFGGGAHYYDEALEAYQLATETRRQQMVAEPGKTGVRRQYADGLGSIAWARWQCCRDLQGALRDAEQSRDIIAGLAKGDPQNLEWFRDTGEADFVIGNILAGAGRREAALAHYGRALEVYRELVRRDPASGENIGRIREVEAAMGVGGHPR